MRFVATAMLSCTLAITARADAIQDDMTSLEAATGPCAAESPMSAYGKASSCARVATAKVAGIGTVSVYRYGSLDKEGIGYRLAFELPDLIWVSSFHKFIVNDCYLHGECTNAVRVTETLRAIDLAGKPAAALEIHVRRHHTNNSPHEDYTTDATRFVVCGFAATKAPRCTSIEVADECHPALNAHGSVSYRCPTNVVLSLDPP